jgi:hypothetical protein
LTEEKTLVSLDDAAEKSCGREKNQGRGTMTRHKTLKTLDDIPHTTPNKVGDIEEDGPGCC